jgi:hypothetical protein
MSSNAYLLSNSQSPALNALQVKSDAFSEFSYKMMRSLGANIAKQRREIKFTPTKGGTSSIDLLKYGLVYNVYLKLVVLDSAATVTAAVGAIPHLLRSVVLSSHSRVIERLDRAQIINYILEKASGPNASILTYSGMQALPAGAAANSHIFYIPLPFSFFQGMSKVKDANHLQNLNISIQFATQDEIANVITAGDAANVTFGTDTCLVQNYYEMDQASTNKLFEMTYSKAGSAPTNQLYTQSYREPIHVGTNAGTVPITFSVPINTKNVVVRSYIVARQSLAGTKENALLPITKVVLNLNGVEFFSAEADAMNFEKIVTSDHYHRIQNNATAGAAGSNFYNMQDFDFRLIDIPACDKFSGGLSVKNTSNAEYLVTVIPDAGNDVHIEVVHEVLNIVQISKADGSMTSVLSI